MGRNCFVRATGLFCLLLTSFHPLRAQSELQKAAGEFKVQTRDLGMRADSPSKPGSGSTRPPWHGRVYENLRNDFLDAVPHEITQRGGDKSLLRRNQFGFNLDGPVVIPWIYPHGSKTFFSISYEGVRTGVARSFLQTVPTLAERIGDFSAVVDQAGNSLPIYDPATTRPNPAFNRALSVTRNNLEYLRDPFPYNRIDPIRIDPVAALALDYYPSPNASVGPFFRNNYFLMTPETNKADGIIAKIEHTVRTRHLLTLDLNSTHGFTNAAATLPTAANPGAPNRTYSNRSATLGHVFTKSPQTVNMFRFTAETEVSTSGDQSQPDYAGKLGLRGSSPMAFPAFYASPYVSMGRSYPQSSTSWTYYFLNEDLSIKQGRHSVTLSARHNQYQIRTFQAAYPSGSFRFGESLTSLPGIIGTGHAFASFLLGLAEYAEKSYLVSPSYFRYTSNHVSVREQFQARPDLTLTFVLGISHQGPRYEKYDRQSSVDLSVINQANGRPGAMVITGQNGIGRTFQRQYVKPEPSVSLAWNPRGDSKTVVRAGYSREYDAPWVSASQWGTQAFNASPVYLSTNVQLEPAVRLADGIPPLDRPLPDTRPDALNDSNADYVFGGSIQPSYHHASFSIGREAPFSAVVSAGASIDTGKDVYVGGNVVNLNAVPLSALAYRDQLNDEAFNRSLRPYPQYKSLNTGGLYPAGRYWQQSAYVSVEKRASAGLSLGFRYSFNRRWDDYSHGRQDYFNRRNEWSLSSTTPHRVSVSYMYELPIGRGKWLFGYSDWRRYLVDGWSLSGSSTYYSGDPISLHPQFNNTGGVISSLRVDVVPGVNPHVDSPGPNGWFNPAAFGQPGDFTLVNASRVHATLRNPSSQNHDVSMSKRFALGADRTLEFNAVGLNFINHANWNNPDSVIGPADSPNVNAGKIIGSRGGRVLQLGLRLSF